MRRLLLLAVIALPSCADDPEPPSDAPRFNLEPGPALAECPDADYSTCDVREQACQARLLELAACVRGDQAPRHLTIDVVSKDDYAELLRERAGGEPEPTVRHFSRALSRFGLAPANGAPTSEQIRDQVDAVAGEYSSDEQRVIIVDHGRPADSSYVDSVLVHEFVHALQDVEHDLPHWPSTDTVWTFDSTLAARTVTEGEASFYENRVAAPLFGLDASRVDFESAFQAFMDRSLVNALDGTLPLTQSHRTLPYGLGGLQAFHAWQNGGPTGVEPLWQDPPLTMHRVLAEVFGRNTPQRAGARIEPPVVSEELSLYDHDTLGAWGLCLALTKRAGEAARAADFIDRALAWRGDHLWVYSDAADNTYALWQLELESAEAAAAMDEFFAVLPIDHGTSGARVFASYNMNALPPRAELTQWGAAWLETPGE